MSAVDELEKIERQAKIHQIKISDLKAELIGCKVEANVQVVGEATQKAIPKTVKVTCKTCGYTEQINYFDLDESEKTFFLGQVVFGKGSNLGLLTKDQKCEKGPHKFNSHPQDYIDFNILFVRDLLDPLLKFDSRVYQTRKIYLVNQTVPYAKKITIHGQVHLEPSTKNITILAEKADPYEDEVSSFKITDEDKTAWNKHFKDKEPEEMLNQIAPGMVGRPQVQEALLLNLHSVSVIPDIYGQPIRGSLEMQVRIEAHRHRRKEGLSSAYKQF